MKTDHESVVGATHNEATTGETQSATRAAALPVFTTQQIADELKYGWSSGGARAFDTGPGDPITVNLSKLTATGQFLARAALDTWALVSGIEFEEVFGSTDPDMDFDDNQNGAFSSHSYWNGTINSSFVNVSTSWLETQGTTIGSYSFQTYLHEIGHALGLSHAGDYDGGATYGVNNHYLNDSWQATVMSYFSQFSNTYIDATYANVLTPMAADILAIQDLYGTAPLRAGDTVYGYNSTAGGVYDDATTIPRNVTYTIVDTGGNDTLDFSGSSDAVRINLAPDSVSDVDGLIGNLSIAVGTIIENAIGSDGSDTIIGNDANNNIYGGAGRDLLRGEDGQDELYGGNAKDTLNGGDGADYLHGGNREDRVYAGRGADTIKGGRHDDKLFGGSGDDVIFGDGGDDILSGDAGDDIFRFNNVSDDDTILDFTVGEDIIAIRRVADSIDDLTITDIGSDTLIEVAGISITLLDVDASSIGSADFDFG